MKRLIIAVVALLFWGLGMTGVVNAADGWAKVKDSNGIKLYERSVPDTDLKEYMAVTTMDAKMEVIGEALRDVSQYTQWLSDCESARVEKKYDRNTYIIYIIQNPLLIKKRDIVLKNETLYDYENGRAKVTFFCTDEVKIPLEKKHVRIAVMNGLFQMEYIGRNKTKFIYKLKVDPAGDIPKKVAYSVMKYYPFNTLKNLKKVVDDSKYSSMAKGSEDEKQINTRSFSEASVRKIFGNSMMRVVKDKTTMAAILAADSKGIKKIASSGSAYETIEKTAREIFSKYIDKIVADKKVTESLRNNKKLHDEISDMVQTYSEADDSTVDSIVAHYKR
jgi:hypothetical protein